MIHHFLLPVSVVIYLVVFLINIFYLTYLFCVFQNMYDVHLCIISWDILCIVYRKKEKKMIYLKHWGPIIFSLAFIYKIIIMFLIINLHTLFQWIWRSIKSRVSIFIGNGWLSKNFVSISFLNINYTSHIYILYKIK